MGSHSGREVGELNRERREVMDFERERDRLRVVRLAVRVMFCRIGAEEAKGSLLNSGDRREELE